MMCPCHEPLQSLVSLGLTEACPLCMRTDRNSPGYMGHQGHCRGQSKNVEALYTFGTRVTGALAVAEQGFFSVGSSMY